ncbi:UNVERIFIED_CONTAM: hypothetical protein PYX00_010508 [Menopon gallinae]|uniref:Single domain-containing protein n=1 Tax=Menopon gallinae TaxID=328185 RepID=A0AAW2HG04_9NEOP
MKSLLVILACLFVTANCALYFAAQKEIPGHEGQCYDEDGTFYEPGQEMKSEPGVCSRVICLGSREGGEIVNERATCGSSHIYPACKVTQDLSKPYPDCCPRVISCEGIPEISDNSF